ncbi:hypothetical protein Tsubulata_047849, partial [Turnera subulata]
GNTRSEHRSDRGAADIIKQPSTIKIVQVDGKLQVLKQPIQARNITSQDPNCFLCSLESMSIGNSVQRVPDEEELQPAQIYFLWFPYFNLEAI